MEVVKENFDPEVFQKAIDGSAFVTFDCEFSGLSLDPNDKRHGYDSTECIYKKMVSICTQYFAFQIGLCTFKWDEASKTYLASPFNYYVYPSSKLINRVLHFQPSTFEFLTEHKMNWVTVFKSGK